MLNNKDKINHKSTVKYLNLVLLQFIILLFSSHIQAQENESNLPHFKGIHVSGVAKVFFTQEKAKEITMTLSGDPFPQVIRKVKNGILEIYTEGEAQNEIVKIFVSNPVLNSVTVSDRGEFHGVKNIDMKTLKIEVRDVGSAEMNINVDKVSIHMNGGDLKVSGMANEQHISKSKASKRGTLDNSLLAIAQ